jgi:hypothetical protein
VYSFKKNLALRLTCSSLKAIYLWVDLSSEVANAFALKITHDRKFLGSLTEFIPLLEADCFGIISDFCNFELVYTYSLHLNEQSNNLSGPNEIIYIA